MDGRRHLDIGDPCPDCGTDKCEYQVRAEQGIDLVAIICHAYGHFNEGVRRAPDEAEDITWHEHYKGKPPE